jgi:hypothetical protein
MKEIQIIKEGVMIDKYIIDGVVVEYDEFMDLVDYNSSYDSVYPIDTYEYDYESNYLVDDNCEPFLDIYDYIEPWEYNVLRKEGGSVSVIKNDSIIEFLFGDEVESLNIRAYGCDYENYKYI